MKGEFEAADVNFINEHQLLSISELRRELVLWDMELPHLTRRVTLKLGGDIDPGLFILRNYGFGGVGTFRPNHDTGIVGLFPKHKPKPKHNKLNNLLKSPKSNPINQKGLVVPVGTFLKETNADKEVKWEDWKQFVTVIDPPVEENYDLHVFHTHVLCLDPLTLNYYVFDFSPYNTRPKATASVRGGPVPKWVKSLSMPPRLPATFSGKIKGLEPVNLPTKVFPTEDGILVIKVGPISRVTKRIRLLTRFVSQSGAHGDVGSFVRAGKCHEVNN